MKRYLDGEILKNIVADENMTQAEFANFMGIHPTYLSELIQGHTPIGAHCRKRLAQALTRLGKDTGGLFLLYRQSSTTHSLEDSP